MKDNLIQKKSFEFSVKIIELYRLLQDQKEFVLSKQLLRSGTSIGANIEEAIAAQSKKDFIAKLSIACKEARETNYWIKLLDATKLVKNIEFAVYLEEINSILNIIKK
ncbi:MAG: four helix bundle protein [Chitinophagales bacterium]